MTQITKTTSILMAVAAACIFTAAAPSSFDANAWVKREATMQAERGRMGHIQRCPSGFKAGVGWSTRGPAEAVRQCCFWYGTKRPAGVRNFGRYPVRYFHVTKGPRGWYAAALYR